MFVKVNYFGFYPLGSDVCYNDVKIMQMPWKEYRFPVLVFGKKQTVNPDFIHIHSSAVKTTVLPVIYHFRQAITTCRSDFYLSDVMVFPSTDKKKFEFFEV